MNTRIRKAGCAVLSAVLLLLIFSPATFARETDTLSALIVAAFDARSAFAKAQNGLLRDPVFLGEVSSPYTDWAAFAMARYSRGDGNGGREYLYPADYDGFRRALGAAVQPWRESAPKTTDLARAAVCFGALDGDLTLTGGYDLFAAASLRPAQNAAKQSVTGLVWALIVLCREGAPSDRQAAAQLLEALFSRQLADGGWALNAAAGISDVDITAMALTALAPFLADEAEYEVENRYTKTRYRVTAAGAAERALRLLSERQLPTGDFVSYQLACAESTAQVLVALTACGIDPETDARFIKNGRTAVDGLKRYRLADGSFTHAFTADPANPNAPAGVYNYMATDQASYALVALWRFRSGLRPLFDLRADPAPAREPSAAATRVKALLEQLRLLLLAFMRVFGTVGAVLGVKQG